MLLIDYEEEPLRRVNTVVFELVLGLDVTGGVCVVIRGGWMSEEVFAWLGRGGWICCRRWVDLDVVMFMFSFLVSKGVQRRMGSAHA